MENFKGREVQFKNGAVLLVAMSPLEEANELLSAILEATQDMLWGVDSEQAIIVTTKNTISRAFMSKRYGRALWTCMARCLYRSAEAKPGSSAVKAVPSCFEAAADRENLVEALFECANENIAPFGKGLYAVSERLKKVIESSPTSTS